VTAPRPQRRNMFRILVTFPDGREQEYYYPTVRAMDDAVEGFRLQGCGVRVL
jgi:hypothetical protein